MIEKVGGKLGFFAGLLKIPRILTLTAAVAVPSAAVATSEPTQIEQAWLQAVQANTIAAYTQFIISFPGSELVDEARCRIDLFSVSSGSGGGSGAGSSASEAADFCLTSGAYQMLFDV